MQYTIWRNVKRYKPNGAESQENIRPKPVYNRVSRITMKNWKIKRNKVEAGSSHRGSPNQITYDYERRRGKSAGSSDSEHILFSYLRYTHSHTPTHTKIWNVVGYSYSMLYCSMVKSRTPRRTSARVVSI